MFVIGDLLSDAAGVYLYNCYVTTSSDGTTEQFLDNNG